MKAIKILIVSAICLTGGYVNAEQYRVPIHQHPPGIDDPMDCHWAEGRRYCARYCYWEVDGVRNCREGKILAYPQGDAVTEEVYETAPRGSYK